MADEAKMEQPIDLSFPVNRDGLTAQDLLTTFMREIQKKGIFLAGVLISKDPHHGILIIGHSRDNCRTWPIQAMQFAVDKYEHAAEKHEQVIKGGDN